MKYQLEKEERDKLMELKKKEAERKRNQEIIRSLQLQVEEKKQQNQHEAYVKDEYMKKWISLTEADAKKRQE